MTYKFFNGLPKIHEHDAKRSQALGISYNGRLVLLYTFESDLGDGWEDQEVHNIDFVLKSLIKSLYNNLSSFKVHFFSITSIINFQLA